MPFALTLFAGAELVGEVLRQLLHLPLPGPVIGMFMLAVALVSPARNWIINTKTGPSLVEKTANTLISNMGLLFVPAGVGIIAELGVLQHQWLPILAGLLVSTVLGLIVTGVVMHRITQRSELNARPAGDTSSSPEMN